MKKIEDVSLGAVRCEFHYPQSDGSVRVEWVEPEEVFKLFVERDKWKDEYFNLSKFATDYEQQRDALRAELKSSRVTKYMSEAIALEKERDQARDALDVAVGALDFYANTMNWRLLKEKPANMTYRYKITSRDGEDIGPEKYSFCGGKRAREALARIEEMRGGK